MSSQPVEFKSRCCWCLWSKGDPATAIKENHQSILHTKWNREYFYPEGQFSEKNALFSVAIYVCGMIGYIVDTIIKIILFVGNLLTLLISGIVCIISDSESRRDYMKDRSVISIDSCIALGISIIGMLIPPLAYRLDAAAKKAMLRINDSSTSEVI